MVDGTIQLPGDSTGKFLDTSDISFGVGTTSRHRERVVLGDPTSTTGLATVTSSAGVLATISSGTVTSTAATNPWSSAPGFNVPVVTVSSGFAQAFLPVTSVAGMASVTSSFGVTVQSTQPVTVSSGLISITSGTVTATAATNPWSSAPGFNVPVVTVSSGLVQISGTATVLSASSGVIQVNAFLISPTSSVAGAGMAVITSSFGVTVQSTQPVTVTSGTVTLSSVHTVTATAATNPWSSAPGFNVPVVTVSSGFAQVFLPVTSVAGFGPVTSSAGQVVNISSGTVTATAGTNPWSSAPGFNVPVVSVSSGLVQISGTATIVSASSGFVQTFVAPPVVTSNIVSTYFYSTGGAASVNVRGSASNIIGYSYFSVAAVPRSIKIYNTSAAPAVGSTVAVLVSLIAPASTAGGGGGGNLTLPLPGLFASAGIGFTMTANIGATDTGAPALNDMVLTLYFV